MAPPTRCWQGSKPEAIDLEILGVLRDAIGPGKDMILARLLGSKAEYDGVVAGMSGSPVYIDGKLVGAIGFRIGQFTKEPIAGITPIAQMLEVAKEDDRPSAITSVAASTSDAAPDSPNAAPALAATRPPTHPPRCHGPRELTLKFTRLKLHWCSTVFRRRQSRCFSSAFTPTG